MSYKSNPESPTIKKMYKTRNVHHLGSSKFHSKNSSREATVSHSNRSRRTWQQLKDEAQPLKENKLLMIPRHRASRGQKGQRTEVEDVWAQKQYEKYQRSTQSVDSAASG